MKRRSVVKLAATAGALALSCFSVCIGRGAMAGTTDNEPRANGFNGLIVTLVSSQASYRVTDTVRLSLRAKNARGADTTVDCLPAPYGTEIQVISADGSLLARNILSTMEPLYTDGRARFHSVVNGGAYDCFSGADLAEWGYRLSAGRYTIRLIFYDAPHPPIFSNDVNIGVTQ